MSKPSQPILNAILIVCLAMAVPALASNTGKIAGRVTDADSGEPLAGATVSVLGMKAGAVADDQGYYHIINLPPGIYSVKAYMIGYAAVTTVEVRANPDLTTKLGFRLKVSPLQGQGVTVVADRPIVDKDLTATQRFIKPAELRAMPWETPEQAIASQSGVVAKGQEFHIRGGRSDEVSYLIDGISIRDATEGTTGLIVNTNALSELSLLTGAFDAEYGEVMSGLISASIKDGGAGDLNVYSNMGSLYKASPERGYRNVQVDWGRPFLHDRVRFFAAGDLTLSQDREPHTERVPHQQKQDYSWLTKSTFQLPADLKLTLLDVRSRSQFGRYSHDWFFMPNGYRSDLRKGRLDVATVNQMLNPSTFYNLSLGWFYNQSKFGVADSFWDKGRRWWEDIRFLDYWDNQIYVNELGRTVFTAEYNPYGLDRTLFYRNGAYWQYRDRVTDQRFFKSDLTAQITQNQMLKGGVQMSWYRVANFYLFPTARGNPIFDIYEHRPRTQAVYLQDKMEYEGLIINLGMRFERFDPNLGVVDTSALWSSSVSSRDIRAKNSLSPRLGLSYVISSNTTFHMGLGKYFQQPQFQYLYQYLAAYDPAEVRDNILGNPTLKPPTTTNLEFGTVTQLGPEWSLNLTLYYKDIRNLIGIAFVPAYPAQYYQYQNLDYATSRGVEMAVIKHFGSHFTGEARYALASAEGTASDANDAMERYLATLTGDSLGPLVKKSIPLDFDQRNKLVLQASLFNKDTLGQGWKGWLFSDISLNAIFHYGSGMPYNAVVLGQNKQEATTLTTQRTPATKQLDLKLVRTFTVWRLEAGLNFEVINLFGWNNYNNAYQDEQSPYQMYFNEWAPSPSEVDFGRDSPYYDPGGDTNNDGVFTPAEQKARLSYFQKLYAANPALSGTPRLLRAGLSIKF